ncbi:uncharacterized protein Gasu_40810 [Galdieria sulphuraria]|uniref:GRAM domain-containing protein n=1 Tax=Galdieria sulphuraria TaxID=130081 RepID=M2WWK2_GALSU|nr:uncharacterized protein Gasu_40810 [Galdieria sulphuraria]EME28385.1 hypothetical protein Gasu_40810 [Galdieria sulphuraria]|eukprot:XP_005704905.1 hypothetical protein Gasu_40810 [Galdieria sulphuraria]
MMSEENKSVQQTTAEEEEEEEAATTTIQKDNNNSNPQDSSNVDAETKSQLIKAFADVTKVSPSQAEEYLQNANWDLQIAVRQYFDHNDTTFGETFTADSIASHIAEIRKKASELSVIAQQKAKENLGFVGQGVSKGWGTLNRFLDNVFHMKEDEEEDIRRRFADMSAQDWESEFERAFPTWAKEHSLIDAFPCSLMQRYRCVDNDATEEQIIEFPGVLFVTVGKVAFRASHDQSSMEKFEVIIGLDEISRIQKGKEGRIRLVTKIQTSFIFSRFKDQVEFESALGILEQIWESSHTKETTKSAVSPDNSTNE